MTFRQAVLSVLTIVVLLFSAGPALWGSVQQQQITDRLELYQTDMMLQASALKLTVSDKQHVPVQSLLVGKSPVDNALKAYKTTRKSARESLQTLQTNARDLESQLIKSQSLVLPSPTSKGLKPHQGTVAPSSQAPSSQAPSAPTSSAPGITQNRPDSSSVSLAAEATQRSTPASPSPQALQLAAMGDKIAQQTVLIEQLNINIGLLQMQQGNISAAIETWAHTHRSASGEKIPLTEQSQLSTTLLNLWTEAPTITPSTEQQIRQHLSGWFRDRALTRLYELQHNTDALAGLQRAEQLTAQKTVRKLALLSAGPMIGGVTGIVLIVFLIIQRFVKGQDAILAAAKSQVWETPWNWEITWQVVIVGFFVVGQFVVPILFQLFKPLLIQVGGLVGLVAGRMTAASTLMVYTLMSAGTIAVLYASIREFGPLKPGWFRINLLEKWWLWGLGGYMVAVPFVIGVSVVNQQIWQGRGGSNPLLQTVLEEGDGVALGIFFFTAAIAAPIFEEILFRGFILPSLTRYTSSWGAIALSSFLFAAAHLSMSEILPLMVLGMVLGFVYTRSKNLLAPMMVHSLWNSATMAGLFILGNSV